MATTAKEQDEDAEEEDEEQIEDEEEDIGERYIEYDSDENEVSTKTLNSELSMSYHLNHD